MKRLIIGLLLAVSFAGCVEKPKFSINESDTSNTYANNPIFTKRESSNPNLIAYKFIGTPDSLYGIKTSGLKVLGGEIIYDPKKSTKYVHITIKGKENIDKLMAELKEHSYLRDFICSDLTIAKDNQFHCAEKQNINLTRNIFISYNPLLDAGYLSITLLNYREKPEK